MFDNYNQKPSFNYDFVFKAIKGVFYNSAYTQMSFVKKEYFDFMLNFCVKKVSQVLGVIPDEGYLSLKYNYYNFDDVKCIIVELPKPITSECECNYFALVMNSDGRLVMFTSEYYEFSNEFCFCKELRDSRMSYDVITNELDDFINAVKKYSLLEFNE